MHNNILLPRALIIPPIDIADLLLLLMHAAAKLFMQKAISFSKKVFSFIYFNSG